MGEEGRQMLTFLYGYDQVALSLHLSPSLHYTRLAELELKAKGQTVGTKGFSSFKL